MLIWANKFATAKIECSFEMDKKTPLEVTFILMAMVHVDIGIYMHVSIDVLYLLYYCDARNILGSRCFQQ